MSIASTVEKSFAIDKETQVKFWASTSRAKVILDLADKLQKLIRLHHVNNKSGRLMEMFQEIVYDNLLCIVTIVSIKVMMKLLVIWF